VEVICNQQDLDLCGLSLEPLTMKYPGLISGKAVTDKNGTAEPGGILSFWDLVIESVQNHAPDRTEFGYLQVKSPYMYRSAQYAIQCLETALARGLDPELYTYMDGIHMGHANQQPTSFRNIGESLVGLSDKAFELRKRCTILGSAHCARERGYEMLEDAKGRMISSCIIRPLKLRRLHEIAGRFADGHSIISTQSGCIHLLPDHPVIPEGLPSREHVPPPLVIIITSTPYGTEIALGALSLAIACAHQGISTRVIFIEDGVYALCGNHVVNPKEQFYAIQDLINSATKSDRLQFFTYTSSLHKRGIQKNRKLNAVLEIGPEDFGKIMFEPPAGITGSCQRVLIF
jgi:tRNA 2-thiouridine synthesizing protein C